MAIPPEIDEFLYSNMAPSVNRKSIKGVHPCSYVLNFLANEVISQGSDNPWGPIKRENSNVLLILSNLNLFSGARTSACGEFEFLP